MPDKKITDLVDGDPLQPTDEFVVARAGDNFKIDGAAVVAAVTKHDVTISGNTAGALAAISSGTMTLAGGNNITLSQAGNAVTISGAATVAQSVQTQNVHNVTLSGNTAGVLAEVSSGTLTLAGGNNITVSQAGNAITISGANVGGAQTGISGIANSETTYTSGTVSLSELGAITIRSTTGQQFQFSVNAQSVQPETQTFIGGISASDTLYTSGTVRITGVGGGVTVSSNTGQRIDISVAPQSVQPETQTFIAGISASDTLYTSGNVRFTGVGGGVTVSSNTGQRVDISVAAQSVQPETQTFIAGISASDTLYTSGNVRFTGVGGGITVSSNTGQRVDLSVAAQSVQPETQTFIGGISASNTLYTSGSVRFTGSQAVTVRSGTGQLVVIDAPAQTTQTQGILSAGVSTGGNTAGNTTVNTGSRLVIVGSNGITASQGTAAGATTITLSGITQSIQTQGVLSAGVSTGGNTAGNTTVNTGSRFVIVASGNATASQATAAGASTVTISVGAQTVQTQGVLSVGVSTGGNTAGNTTVNTGSRLVIVGSNGITASQGTAAGATTITLSGVTTAAQTNQTGNVYAASNTTGTSSGTYDARTLSIAGDGIISVAASNSGWRISATQSVQTQGILNVALSNIGNTSGDTGLNSGTRLVLAGGNNITLSASSAAGATTVTISAPNLGAGAFSGGASTGGNTAGATGITGTQLVFVGTGPISLSQTTGANGGTLSINAPATSSLSATGIVSLSTNGSTISVGAPGYSGGMSTNGNTAGDTGYASQRLNLVGSNNITLSGSTDGGSMSISIIGGAGGGFSGGMSTEGNTAGNTGVTGTRLVFVGSGPVSLSQTTGAAGGTLSINAPATSSLSATGIVSLSTNGSTISVGAPAFSAGMSTNGNTAGDTGYASQRLNLIGGNGVTLSGSTNGGSMSITISGGGGGGGIRGGVSTGGNTAGSTGTISTGNLVLVGVSPISLSQSTGAAGSDATVSILAPASSLISGTGLVSVSTNGSTISIGVPGLLNDWENFPQGNAYLQTHIASISKTPFYWHEAIPGRITNNSLMFKVSFVTANTLASLSAHLGVYTFVNSTSMALLGSLSESYVVSSASSVSFSGVRNLVMTGIGTHAALSVLQPGNYAFGMMFSAGATASMNASLFGHSTSNGPLGNILPGVNQLSTGTSQGGMALWGRGSTTVNAMPNNVVASELVNQGSGASMQLHPWIYLRS